MQAVKILQSSELEYFSIEYVSFHVTFNVYVQRVCLKEPELLKKVNDHQSKRSCYCSHFSRFLNYPERKWTWETNERFVDCKRWPAECLVTWKVKSDSKMMSQVPIIISCPHHRSLCSSVTQQLEQLFNVAMKTRLHQPHKLFPRKIQILTKHF